MDGSVTALNCNFNTSLADCKETTKSIETPNLSGNSHLLNVFLKWTHVVSSYKLEKSEGYRT